DERERDKRQRDRQPRGADRERIGGGNRPTTRWHRNGCVGPSRRGNILTVARYLRAVRAHHWHLRQSHTVWGREREYRDPGAWWRTLFRHWRQRRRHDDLVRSGLGNASWRLLDDAVRLR